MREGCCLLVGIVRSLTCWTKWVQSRGGRRIALSSSYHHCHHRQWDGGRQERKGNLLGCLPIVVEFIRDEAARLLDFLNDARLVHHVPLSERYEFLQVVGEELASNVDPVHAFRSVRVRNREEREVGLTDGQRMRRWLRVVLAQCA
jgi:hypothetical protein